jgi:hypothetical protein
MRSNAVHTGPRSGSKAPAYVDKGLAAGAGSISVADGVQGRSTLIFKQYYI